MKNSHFSPLSDPDMDTLEHLSEKANVYGQINRYTPIYVALDVGDASQQNGYLFVAWPALNSRSAHCARLIFEYIGDVVWAEFGAKMIATTPQGAPDVPNP